MGFWSEAVLPRLVDWGMNSEGLGRHRARALVDVRGRVLEVGFGSGLNLPHYPEGVEAVVGVEPSVLAHRLAARRIEAAPFPVELIPLEGEKIPCADHAFDVAVSTFSLCTIPGVQDALQQIRRVLKPGGRFVFLEHGRAPDAAVARWQDRWNPTWSCMFGGARPTARSTGWWRRPGSRSSASTATTSRARSSWATSTGAPRAARAERGAHSESR